MLEIAVPITEFGDLWRGIARQWPSYLAFATSFWTIGGIWAVHHGIFRRMRLANPTVMRLNLVLLMAVSFLPFPTRLMAEALREPSAEGTSVLFYGATLFVVTAVTSALGRYGAPSGAAPRGRHASGGPRGSRVALGQCAARHTRAGRAGLPSDYARAPARRHPRHPPADPAE